MYTFFDFSPANQLGAIGELVLLFYFSLFLSEE